MSYRTQHLRGFEKMLSTFGTSLTFNGQTIQCLADTKPYLLQLRQTNMMPVRPVRFSLRRTDFDEIGLEADATPRQVIESDEHLWEVQTVVDDDACGTVDLTCNAKI